VRGTSGGEKGFLFLSEEGREKGSNLFSGPFFIEIILFKPGGGGGSERFFIFSAGKKRERL